MKTTPVTPADLGASVIAVPPLARSPDLSLSREQNRLVIRHLEWGGVTTLMYGGNANFYNLGVSDYARTVTMLPELASPRTWVIPSVGPDYGKMLDQAAILREMEFPAAMVLPLGFPATSAGAATGIRRFVERSGQPAIVYVKAEGTLDPDDAGRLAADGLVAAIKYAVVQPDPADDPYLARLVERVDRARIISGIGERPAIVHLRRFGLAGFTSGSVCVAPSLSTAILRALRAGDEQRAAALREHFLRSRISATA